MSKEFITNQDKLLAEVVNNYLKDSENLCFLIGFFYFSGFEEIVDNIGDKKLRRLVSVNSELNYNESSIVAPELPGIISREDYEKAGIEELEEWEKVSTGMERKCLNLDFTR
ncbi:hypothetical protein SAMN05444280_10626 [Tangfeifania diversioriginum]|uniref:Uncharacterized protein n=1 Tax=Tangfeifania diversioriginum TaxID=1168035 RepID=A0A1M6E1N8_9BACT|nr:hypothetical protein [Tangfeifania diversioriginum]SHI79407.1 hypothetical protein SAMN05444280_10626 [Tangfeifania diversioriginum]